MSKKHSVLKGSSVLLLSLAFGCQQMPGATGNLASGIGVAGGAGLISNNAGGLISNNAGGLISNNAGGLISNNAGGLISNNAGGLISNNAGGLISNNAGGLAGSVSGPASGLISNNAGGLISNNAGGLISNNAGGLISNNAGGLISNNAGGYSVLDTAGSAATSVAPGAKVAVFNERGEQISYSWTTTDANGNYEFDKLKPSGPLLFVKAVYEQEGQQVVLMSTAPAPRKPQLLKCSLSPATTLVAKKISQMITMRAVAVTSVSQPSVDSVVTSVAKVMSPKAVVAAAIYPADRAAATFDTMVQASPQLSTSLASTPAATNFVAQTPSVPLSAPPQTTGGSTGASSTTASSSSGGSSGATVDQGTGTAASGPATSGTPTSSGSTGSSGSGSSSSGSSSSAPAETASVVTLGSAASGANGVAFISGSLYVPNSSTGLASGTVSSLAANSLTLATNAADTSLLVVSDGTNTYKIVGSTLTGGSVKVTANAFALASGLVVSGGTAYVSAASHNCVYSVDLASGTQKVLAGVDSNQGQGGATGLNAPTGLTFANGLLYVADKNNNRIEAIDPATGNMTLVAGGSTQVGGVDGVGAAASFSSPAGVTADGSGNLYVADTNNDKIRKIVIATGTVSSVAGNGVTADTDGVGTSAAFSFPEAISWGSVGGKATLFVQEYNGKIRGISGM